MDIIKLYESGLFSFAENKLQEAIKKQAELKHYPIEWHFIGRIQRNKTKDIATSFAWVQSIDRILIATRLNSQRPDNMPPLQICIQVNLDTESTKSGIICSEIYNLAHAIQALPKLKLRGLMCIPKAYEDDEAQYLSFLRLTALYNDLNNRGFSLDTLSMGMSDDFCAAIRAGSTMIRLGKVLFE